MKKILLMTCALVALTAGIAAAGAGALNLSWNDCGLAGADNRTSLCNTNSGTNTLVGSFYAPCCVSAASANEVVIDVQTSGLALSRWWELRAGLCRPASLTASPDFSGGPFTCYDYWAGFASSGVSADPPIGNRIRIKVLVALPAGHAQIGPIAEGTETYSFKVNINNAKTVGLGACAGCPDQACIVLNSIKINQPVGSPGGSKFISAPGDRNYATWQGWTTGGDCGGKTPARNQTWGSVKALYR
jgi:hypothetical protein